MKHLSRIVLVAAAAGLGSLAMAAGSAAPAPFALRFATALETFNQKLGPEGSTRPAPPDSDPDIVKATADLVAARDAFGSKSFPVKFPDTFNSVCNPVQKLAERYLLAGSGTTSLGAVSAEESGKNGMNHEAVLIPALTFSYKCMALHMPELDKFWANMPAADRTESRRKGITMIHNGLSMTTVGLVASASMPGFTRPKQKDMADTLAKYSPLFAAVLPLKERAALSATIDRDYPGFQKTWPKQYRAVHAGLANTTCGAICQS